MIYNRISRHFVSTHPPLQNKTANAAGRRFYAQHSGDRSEQIAFRSHDADFAVRDFDPLGKCTEMIAAITATFIRSRAVPANLRTMMGVIA